MPVFIVLILAWQSLTVVPHAGNRCAFTHKVWFSIDISVVACLIVRALVDAAQLWREKNKNQHELDYKQIIAMYRKHGDWTTTIQYRRVLKCVKSHFHCRLDHAFESCTIETITIHTPNKRMHGNRTVTMYNALRNHFDTDLQHSLYDNLMLAKAITESYLTTCVSPVHNEGRHF